MLNDKEKYNKNYKKGFIEGVVFSARFGVFLLTFLAIPILGILNMITGLQFIIVLVLFTISGILINIIEFKWKVKNNIVVM